MLGNVERAVLLIMDNNLTTVDARILSQGLVLCGEQTFCWACAREGWKLKIEIQVDTNFEWAPRLSQILPKKMKEMNATHPKVSDGDDRMLARYRVGRYHSIANQNSTNHPPIEFSDFTRPNDLCDNKLHSYQANLHPLSFNKNTHHRSCTWSGMFECGDTKKEPSMQGVWLLLFPFSAHIQRDFAYADDLLKLKIHKI